MMETRRILKRFVVVFSLLGLILLPCGLVFVQFHPPYLTRAINRRLAKVSDYKIRVSRAQIQPFHARLLGSRPPSCRNDGRAGDFRERLTGQLC